MDAMTKPRFAVIGTGSMAASMMSTLAQAGVRVTAVASRDPQRSRRFATTFGIPKACEGLDSLLCSTEVDAVYIANATAEHATTAIAALEAGKAVLCEKPLSVSADEGERVAEVARRTRNLCMEGIGRYSCQHTCDFSHWRTRGLTESPLNSLPTSGIQSARTPLRASSRQQPAACCSTAGCTSSLWL